MNNTNRIPPLATEIPPLDESGKIRGACVWRIGDRVRIRRDASAVAGLLGATGTVESITNDHQKLATTKRWNDRTAFLVRIALDVPFVAAQYFSPCKSMGLTDDQLERI